MNRTPIEWCRTYKADGSYEEGYSVNPVRFLPRGATRTTTMCQRVSQGCTHCYAEGITRRFWPKDADEGFHGYNAIGLLTGEFVLDEKTLLSVLKHKKPARIFWGDMTDLFQASVPDAMLDQCFAVCALTPHLTHMFLTKRPERMLEYFGRRSKEECYRDIACTEKQFAFVWRVQKRILDLFNSVSTEALNRAAEANNLTPSWPLPNVWLGTSVEDQAQADKRIPLLLQTPSWVHFISAEPLLGEILLEMELVRRDSLAAMLARYHPDRDGRIGDFLVAEGVVTREAVQIAADAQQRLMTTAQT